MTITLSPDIERVLTEEAARRQKTPDELAEEILRARLPVPVGHAGPRDEELWARVNAARGMFAPEDLTPKKRKSGGRKRWHGFTAAIMSPASPPAKSFQPARWKKKH